MFPTTFFSLENPTQVPKNDCLKKAKNARFWVIFGEKKIEKVCLGCVQILVLGRGGCAQVRILILCLQKKFWVPNSKIKVFNEKKISPPP